MSLIEIRELQEDMAFLRKEFIAICKRNKELECINERLRAELDVTRLQHTNALEKLKDCGVVG